MDGRIENTARGVEHRRDMRLLDLHIAAGRIPQQQRGRGGGHPRLLAADDVRRDPGVR